MDFITELLFEDPHLLDGFCLGAPALEFDSRLFWEPLSDGATGAADGLVLAQTASPVPCV